MTFLCKALMDGYPVKLKTLLEQSTVTGQLRLSNFQLSKLPSLPDSLDLTDITDIGIHNYNIYLLIYIYIWIYLFQLATLQIRPVHIIIVEN